jgi:hypothetical protein
VLQQLGSRATTAAGGTSSPVPAALHHLLGEAAISGLHDTMLALMLIAAGGVVAALFIQSMPPQERKTLK